MKTCIKKIVRIFTLSVLIGIPIAGFAQKMDKPNIDKFLNDTTLFTTTEKIATSKPEHQWTQEIDAYFSKLNGDIHLHVIVKLPCDDYTHFYFTAGTPIMLKLANNTFISLSTTADVDTQQGYMDGGFLNMGTQGWIGDIQAPISNDDLQKLSASSLTAIRVQSPNINLDFDCIPTGGELIKNMVGLIVAAK